MPDRPNVSDPGRIVAHRGASQVAPENTLAAFRAAERQGAWWVEFDVSLLGDGTAVVHHDATLDRCTNRTGPLTGISAAALPDIDCGNGEPLPTLDQALDLIHDLGFHANLEMKPHMEPAGRMSDVVARALRARPWTRDRIIVSSFSMAELEAIRRELPEAALATLFHEPPANWAEIVDRMGAAAMHVQYGFLTGSLVSSALRHGIDLRTYTANDPDLIAPFRDLGLTGVITDHPPAYLDRPEWQAWSRT